MVCDFNLIFLFLIGRVDIIFQMVCDFNLIFLFLTGGVDIIFLMVCDFNLIFLLIGGVYITSHCISAHSSIGLYIWSQLSDYQHETNCTNQRKGLVKEANQLIT